MQPTLNLTQNILEYIFLDKSSVPDTQGRTKELILENVGKVDAFKIKYCSNGKKVVGYVLIPKEDKKYPCIIFNRGGAKEHGKLHDAYVLSFLGWYASQGYVVIASQYSGNDGSEGKDEFGGSDLDDVLNLKSVLQDFPQSDTDNIFMMGVSRGGMMAYMAMTKVDWIKAVATVGGRTNIERSYGQRPDLKEFRRELYDVDNKNENMKRSAVYWVEKLNKNTPLLLLHGSADEEVSVQDSLDLGSELYKHNHPFAMQIFKDGDHALSQYKKERNASIISWFESNILS